MGELVESGCPTWDTKANTASSRELLGGTRKQILLPHKSYWVKTHAKRAFFAQKEGHDQIACATTLKEGGFLAIHGFQGMQ